MATRGAVALLSSFSRVVNGEWNLGLRYRNVHHARLTARIEPRPTTEKILLIKCKLWNAVQTVRNADVKLPRNKKTLDQKTKDDVKFSYDRVRKFAEAQLKN